MHLLLDILAVVELRRKQHVSLPGTEHACDTASFVDAQGHFLGLSIALPTQLDAKGTVGDHRCFVCLQQFPCFCRGARHEMLAIGILDIHNHWL
jgi:hypothetical protein